MKECMDECVHESLARGGRHGHRTRVPGVHGTFQHIGHSQPGGLSACWVPSSVPAAGEDPGSGRDGPWIDAETGWPGLQPATQYVSNPSQDLCLIFNTWGDLERSFDSIPLTALSTNPVHCPPQARAPVSVLSPTGHPRAARADLLQPPASGPFPVLSLHPGCSSFLPPPARSSCTPSSSAPPLHPALPDSHSGKHLSTWKLPPCLHPIHSVPKPARLLPSYIMIPHYNPEKCRYYSYSSFPEEGAEPQRG